MPIFLLLLYKSLKFKKHSNRSVKNSTIVERKLIYIASKLAQEDLFKLTHVKLHSINAEMLEIAQD